MDTLNKMKRKILISVSGFLSFYWMWTEQDKQWNYHGQTHHIAACITGPNTSQGLGGCYGRFDMDNDYDIDLKDWALYTTKMSKGQQ